MGEHELVGCAGVLATLSCFFFSKLFGVFAEEVEEEEAAAAVVVLVLCWGRLTKGI